VYVEVPDGSQVPPVIAACWSETNVSPFSDCACAADAKTSVQQKTSTAPRRIRPQSRKSSRAEATESCRDSQCFVDLKGAKTLYRRVMRLGRHAATAQPRTRAADPFGRGRRPRERLAAAPGRVAGPRSSSEHVILAPVERPTVCDRRSTAIGPKSAPSQEPLPDGKGNPYPVLRLALVVQLGTRPVPARRSRSCLDAAARLLLLRCSPSLPLVVRTGSQAAIGQGARTALRS
jgi:hypothetical protein